MQDVKEKYGYFVVIVGAVLVVMFFNFIRTYELIQAIVAMDGLLSFVLHLCLWIRRNKLKEKLGSSSTFV